MIKGLYFKLNMDNERDRTIYKFFNSLEKSDSKVEVLYNLISSITAVKVVDIHEQNN